MPINCVGGDLEITGSVGAYPCLIAQAAPCVPCLCMQMLVADTIIVLNASCMTNFCDLQGAGCCNFACMRTYAGRLLILRRGTCTEETRFVTTDVASAPCTNRLLTVSENWCTNPATNDTVEFAYDVADAGSTLCMDVVVCMFSGIVTFETPVQIGDACGAANFGFFYLGCGTNVTFEDMCCSTCLIRLAVNCGGFFQTGYLVGKEVCRCTAKAVSGAGLLTKDCTAECPCPTAQNWINIENGGTFRSYASSISVVNDPDTFTIATGCCSCIDFDCVKMAKYLQNATFLNNTTVRNFNMEGLIGAPCQSLEIEASTNIQSMNMISTAGFITTGTVPCPCPGQEVLNLRCVTFVNTTPLVTVDTDRTWNFINPVWAVCECNQGDLAFNACVSCAEVNEKYSLKARTITPGGVVIGCSGFYLYEDLRTKAMSVDEVCACFQFTGDMTTGIICQVFTFKNYVRCGNCCLTVLTDGCHFLKTYKYGKTPSISSVTSCSAFDSDVTLLCDSFTCATEATARALACIKVRLHTTLGTAPCRCDARPMTAIRYACGTGTAPVFGVTIADCRAACADAEGTFVELIGDNTSGTLLLESRNAVAFLVANDMICNGIGWSATICTTTCVFDFVEDYTWQVDGGGARSIQNIYDYFQAKIMEAGTIACGICCVACQRFMQMVEWGRCARSLPFTPACICCTLDLATFRIFQCGCATSGGTVGQGVWISRKTGGTISSLVSDCGVAFTPPASATLTLTNIEEFSDVWIYTNPSCTNTTPLASQPCCVNCACACNPCKFKFVFTYCTPFCGCFQIKVISLCFQEVNQIDCAGSSNKTVRIQQTPDRNFDDPC